MFVCSFLLLRSISKTLGPALRNSEIDSFSYYRYLFFLCVASSVILVHSFVDYGLLNNNWGSNSWPSIVVKAFIRIDCTLFLHTDKRKRTKPYCSTSKHLVSTCGFCLTKLSLIVPCFHNTVVWSRFLVLAVSTITNHLCNVRTNTKFKIMKKVI